MRTRTGDAAPLLEVEEDGQCEDGQCKQHRPSISTSSWTRTAGLAVGAVLIILALRAAHEELRRWVRPPDPVPRVAEPEAAQTGPSPNQERRRRLTLTASPGLDPGPLHTLTLTLICPSTLRAAAAMAATRLLCSSATGSSRCTCSPSARSSSDSTCRTGAASPATLAAHVSRLQPMHPGCNPMYPGRCLRAVTP